MLATIFMQELRYETLRLVWTPFHFCNITLVFNDSVLGSEYSFVFVFPQSIKNVFCVMTSLIT